MTSQNEQNCPVATESSANAAQAIANHWSLLLATTTAEEIQEVWRGPTQERLKDLGVQFANDVVFGAEILETYTCRFDCARCSGKIVLQSEVGVQNITLPEECMAATNRTVDNRGEV